MGADGVEEFLAHQKADLGPISRAERNTIIAFLFTVVGWLLRTQTADFQMTAAATGQTDIVAITPPIIAAIANFLDPRHADLDAQQ